MAHELTSLFSNDFSLSNLLTDIEKNNKFTARNVIHQLQEQNQRATEILATFRNMARGQTLGKEENVDLEVFLPELIQRFKQYALLRNVDLFYENNLTSPVEIKIKRIDIELILYNLLLNAAQQIERIKFFRSGRGEISIGFSEEIENDQSRWCVIQILDNGPGIHKQDFKRVFNIHFTTKEDGCGMGLDICREIAHKIKIFDHRGEVKVLRSILLAGTIFEIRLPL